MAELAVDAVVLWYERVSKVRFDRNPKFSCNSPGNQVKSDGFLLKKKMQIRYKGSYNNFTQEILVTLISIFSKCFVELHCWVQDHVSFHSVIRVCRRRLWHYMSNL
jgi:hypothetical protein